MVASVVAEGFEEMVEAEGMWYFVVMRVCLVSAEVYRGVGG